MPIERVNKDVCTSFITLGTGLSTLYIFRSDNENALITLENDINLSRGETSESEIQCNTVSAIIDDLSKVDTRFTMCLSSCKCSFTYAGADFWSVHDEIESLLQPGTKDIGKFAPHDVKIDGPRRSLPALLLSQ
jgi:hypothetical protein